MSKLTRLWSSVAGYKVDPELLIAYRSAIPTTVDLRVTHRNHHYVATIISIEKNKLPKDVLLVTEAESDARMVEMVNDLVLSYKQIPEVYRPYFRGSLKPQGATRADKDLTLVKV